MLFFNTAHKTALKWGGTQKPHRQIYLKPWHIMGKKENICMARYERRDCNLDEQTLQLKAKNKKNKEVGFSCLYPV